MPRLPRSPRFVFPRPFGFLGRPAKSALRPVRLVVTPLEAREVPAGLDHVATIEVSTDGAHHSSGAKLKADTTYHVYASGAFIIGQEDTSSSDTTKVDFSADAEYLHFDGGVKRGETTSYATTGNDNGLRFIYGTGNKFSGSWGAYDEDHKYSTTVVGQGEELEAWYDDINYGDNEGTLTLEIYEGDPVPKPKKECDCQAGPTADEPGGGNAAAPAMSTNPVGYGDGVLRLAGTDLSITAGGITWGLTRSWSNDPATALTTQGMLGSGWVDSFQPYAVRGADAAVTFVVSATAAHRFDKIGGNYYPAAGGGESVSETGSYLTLTDAAGRHLQFYSFAPTWGSRRGQLASVTDPAGYNVTLSYADQAVYVAGSSSTTAASQAVRPQLVSATLTSPANDPLQQIVYSYDSAETTVGAATITNTSRRVAAAALQTYQGGWVTVRSAAYSYYTAADESANTSTTATVGGKTVTTYTWLGKGTSGALAGVTITEGSATVSADYYRYYPKDTFVNVGGVDRQVGYRGGLKYAFSDASVARLKQAIDDAIAAKSVPSTTVYTVSDEFAGKFADNYFEYDVQHRVTKEVAQGEGCSVCASGLGTFTFKYEPSAFAAGPNAWAMKTTETLPDNSQNVVYTNARGQAMVEAFRETATSPEWVTYHRYDGNWREILTAQPSAVSGYNETVPTLMAWSTGQTAGSVATVNATQTGDQTGPQVAFLPDGRRVVVWASPDASGGGIFARLYATDGTAGSEFAVNATTLYDQGAPDVAVAPDGRFMVVWQSWNADGDQFGIAGRVFNADGAPLTSDLTLNTTSAGWQNAPSVAADGSGNFVAAWQSSVGGSAVSYDARARRFDRDGAALGGEFVAGAVSGTEVAVHARVAAAPDGRFAVAYNLASSSDAGDIYLRQYAADGTPLTASPALVNSAATSGWQWFDDLAMDTAGRVLVVYQAADYHGWGVFARAYTTAGAAAGASFGVTETVFDHQDAPAVAAAPGGGYVVAWHQESASTGGGDAIYARRVNGDGTFGGEFQVDGGAGGDMYAPAVAAWDGGFSVTWQGQDTAGWGIFARDYRVGGDGLRDYDGLIAVTDYATVTTATTATVGGKIVLVSGDVKGYMRATYLLNGERDATPTAVSLTKYFEHADAAGAMVHPVAGVTRFAADTSVALTTATGAETTEYRYDWLTSGSVETNRVSSMTTTLAKVATVHLGANAADTRVTVYDAAGRVTWAQDESKYISHTEYDAATGTATLSIADVDVAKTWTFSGAAPSGWATPADGGRHLTTAMEVDGRGRVVRATVLGETTASTSPAQAIRTTYTVYKDASHEVRTYTWDPAAGVPLGPVTVTRADRARGYTESLSYAPTYISLTGGRPDGTESIAYQPLASLSRTLVNSAGQAMSNLSYYSFDGMAYDNTVAAAGAQGVNYFASLTDYDARGRQNRTVTPAGTIARTVYDARGRASSVWIGTDDTADATGDYWTPAKASDTAYAGQFDLVKVSEYTYDGGGVGDGNMTKSVAYPHQTGVADRATLNWYDWRNLLVATKAGAEETEDTAVNRPLTYLTLDNLGRATSEAMYDGDGVTLTATGGVPDAPGAEQLRGLTTTSYDERGRAYRTQVWSVSPVNGAVGDSLRADTWYDARGLAVKTLAPGGLVTKVKYDGVGRAVVVSQTDGGGDTTHAHALTLAGDVVLEQVATDYAAADASGGPVVTAVKQRFHDATGTGDLGDATSGVGARVSYAAAYTDAIGRPLASVDVGTNGGDAWAAPTYPPSSSATIHVTSVAYDAYGDATLAVDARGNETHTAYDRLGRVLQSIDGFYDGLVSPTDDRKTDYAYNGFGQLYRQNLLNSDMDELYHPSGYGEGYDRLGQLTAFARGALSETYTGNGLDAVASPSRTQSWVTDGMGNFTSVTTDGVAETREHDRRNRLTAMGSATLGYDEAGNQTADEGGATLTYDGWGRLVGAGGDSSRYAYDALGRRIREGSGEAAHTLLYSPAWQVVEERWGGDGAAYQYVWSPVYVDALVARLTVSGGEVVGAVWVQQDANFNVTSLTDGAGTVLERFAYDPYGAVTVYDDAWKEKKSGSEFDWVYLHQGGRYDAISGLYHFRNRDLDPVTGRWTRLDPMGFGAGDGNLYRYVGSNPVIALDPFGLWEQLSKEKWLEILKTTGSVQDGLTEKQLSSSGGDLFQTYVKKSLNKTGNDVNFQTYGPGSRTVKPDIHENYKYYHYRDVPGPLGFTKKEFVATVDQIPVFIEVKMQERNVRLSDPQINGMLDALSYLKRQRDAIAMGPNAATVKLLRVPSLIFVTSSDSQISEDVVQEASRQGIFVLHSVAEYECKKGKYWLRVPFWTSLNAAAIQSRINVQPKNINVIDQKPPLPVGQPVEIKSTM